MAIVFILELFLILHGSIALGNPFFLHFELHKLCKWVGVCNIRWVARGSNTIIKNVKVWKQKPAVFYERSIHENCVCCDLLQSKEKCEDINNSNTSYYQRRRLYQNKIRGKGAFLTWKNEAKWTFAWSPRAIIEILGGFWEKQALKQIISLCQPDWAGLPLIMSASFIFLCLDSSLLMESSNCGNPPRVLIEENKNLLKRKKEEKLIKNKKGNS